MSPLLTGEKFKLTRESIEARCKPPQTGYKLYWDSELRNFGVRVTSAAVRSYIVQRRVNGKERRITLARCDLWPPEKARNEARGYLGDFARGKDPQEERANKRAASEARGHTLASLMQVYADHLKARGKPRSAKDVEYAVKTHLTAAHPRIAKTPAREVARRDVAAIVRKLAEAGKLRRAAMLRSYIMAAYNLALRAESDPSAPSSLLAYRVETSPVVGVATVGGSNVARDRRLSDDELKHFLGALDEYKGVAGDVLRLALLAGGQRPQQVARLTVADVDKDGFIRLLDAKGRRAQVREHFVPLAEQGKALALKLAQQAKDAGFSLLFTSDGKKPVRIETVGAAVAEIAAQMVKDKNAAELFQARDLRRTAETRLAALGISRDLRSQLLSHGISGIQAKHYDRHDYADEKRRALVAWEKHLADVRAGKTGKGGKVTSIRRKRA